MDGVVAAVRCRPMKVSEEKLGRRHALEILPESKKVIVSGEREFTFNHAFSDDSSQEQIYNELVQPIVGKVIEGYNGCVMAYGQTGSGKTYTMGTQAKCKTPGIIQKALQEIFSNGSAMEIQVSFLEVYKQVVLDLLSSEKKKLHLNDFKPVGLTLIKVEDVESALTVLELGLGNRHVGKTNANLHSSRSHAVFTIYVSKTLEDCQSTSKLYLVDLAGSESASGEFGDTRREGVMINQGLLQLGNVMSALSTAGQDHIPYRNSALTCILKETLSLQNYILLIACVSPLDVDVTTTTSSLQFATRVGSIKCNPEAGLFIKQVPLTTPFKVPHNKKKGNTTIAITTPSSRGKVQRPALRPLNNTYDSPRTPLVRDGKKQFWPTSTPFQSVAKPLFSEPTPILGKRRSSSEWSALDISSSTDIDSTVAQVKAHIQEENKTCIVPNSENETWLRSIIADVIREELKSHTFLGHSTVNNGPSPKKPRRSARLTKSTFFEHEPNETVIASSPNCYGSPNLAGNTTAFQPSLSGLDSDKTLTMSGAHRAQPLASVRRSTRLSTKFSRQSEIFDPNITQRSTIKKNALKDTVPVRRSTRLSVAPRPIYISGSSAKFSDRSKMDESIGSESKKKKDSKKSRWSARLSTLRTVEPEHAQEHLNNIVLDILQNGDVKKLQSLPTIGPKTAVIISNNRLLHGPIETLKDLENVRGLSKNFAKRFFWANNIVLEDDSEEEEK